ncbi:MAG: prepilin-type N-terminal cleavage/methylation domain-containing protein [bacterium]
MASHKTCTHKSGFTLVEVLIVFGIFALLVGLSLCIDPNNYRGDAFRAEESAIVTLLQTARADSLNNIDQRPHGVALFPSDHKGSYVIFEGKEYVSRNQALDEVLDALYPIAIASTSPTEIDFEQLTGDAMRAGAGYDGDITLLDTERGASVSVHINHEGSISW